MFPFGFSPPGRRTDGLNLKSMLNYYRRIANARNVCGLCDGAQRLCIVDISCKLERLITNIVVRQ